MTDSADLNPYQTISIQLTAVKKQIKDLCYEMSEIREILKRRKASDTRCQIMEHQYEKDLELMRDKELELDRALEEARKAMVECETDESKELVRMINDRLTVESRHRDEEDLMSQKELDLLEKPGVQIMCRECYQYVSGESLISFHPHNVVRCKPCMDKEYQEYERRHMNKFVIPNFYPVTTPK